MKKNLKIAACGLLVALGTTALASCGDNSLAKEVLSKVILTQEGEKVSADFTVPKTVNHNGNSYEVTWTSSDTSVIDIIENNATTFTADVKRPFDANADINLTASVTVDGQKAKNTFKTTVTSIDAKDALSTAIANVGIKASYGAKEELDLPAKSNEYKDEITFEYTLGGEYTSAKLENLKLSLDPELGQETIVVKVKATSGSTVVEKEVNTKTSLKTVYLSVTEALAQPKDAMIYFQGKIKSIVSDKYGNFWIEDESGKEIEIYGLYQGKIDVCYDENNTWTKKGIRYDAWNDFEKLAVGDYVYAYGTRAVYGTTQEVSNCLLMGTVKGFPVSTVKEALDTPKGDFVAFSGEVKSIASDKYGNMYLKDGENEIYLYGCYTGKVSACYDDKNAWIKTNNPAVRYDAMKDKPQVGDVIVVYGPRTEYNGTQQVTNALLLYYVSKTERQASTTTPTTPTDSNRTVTGTTIEFKNLNYENAAEVTNIAFTDGTLTFAQGTNENNSPKYYNTGNAVRMYGANTLTIKSDKKIVKVEFVLIVDESSKAYAFTAENCSISTGQMNYETSTWTGEANEIVLSYTPKSGQFRIAKIIVSYEQ